jgi:hypothetical protein
VVSLEHLIYPGGYPCHGDKFPPTLLKRLHQMCGGSVSKIPIPTTRYSALNVLERTNASGMIPTEIWLSFLIEGMAYVLSMEEMPAEKVQLYFDRLMMICSDRLNGLQLLREIANSPGNEVLQSCMERLSPEQKRVYEAYVSWITLAQTATTPKEILDYYVDHVVSRTPANEPLPAAHLFSIADLISRRGLSWGDQILAFAVLIGLNPRSGLLKNESTFDVDHAPDIANLLNDRKGQIFTRLSATMPQVLSVGSISTPNSVRWTTFLIEQFSIMSLAPDLLPTCLDWGTRLRNICHLDAHCSYRELDTAIDANPELYMAKRPQGWPESGGYPLLGR